MFDFVLIEFELKLDVLDKPTASSKRKNVSMHCADAFKAGQEALRIADDFAYIKPEVLKLMGIYFWLIGKQRKAMRWWRKALHVSQSMNARLELSRTYFEIGKRLSESTSRHKEMDGITAEEYLTKARAMFEDMNLPWDLDELEKLRIQSAS